MKKALSIVLCMLLLCGLSACSKSNTSSEFSSYYINADVSTDKESFDESENSVTTDDAVNAQNETESDNVSINNESTIITENNNSVSNTNTNTDSKVETPVTPSAPVIEEPTTPSTPTTPSEPQYKTLKLHEKTTYNGVEGCFALESEVYTLDLVSIGVTNNSDERSYFWTEYYNVDTNEAIIFMGAFGILGDGELADIMQKERVPVKVQ